MSTPQRFDFFYLQIETTGAWDDSNTAEYCINLLLNDDRQDGVSTLVFQNSNKVEIKMAANDSAFPIFQGSYKINIDEAVGPTGLEG